VVTCGRSRIIENRQYPGTDPLGIDEAIEASVRSGVVFRFAS